MSKGAAVLVALAVLSGCGVRQIEAADGSRSTDIYFGLSNLPACDGRQVVGMRETLVGAWASGRRAGLGVQAARYACLSEKCQVILWIDSDESAEAVAAKVRDMENICVRS